MTYLFVFIAFFGLITLHEVGHFLAARKFGVKVEEFGIFLPPRIYGKKIGETIYSINLLPFGAFVRIFGQDSRTKEEGSFNSKPIWQRAIILFAGVFVFWIIAFFIYTFIFAIGVDQSISDDMNGFENPKVQITGIAPGSPAESSEIMIGDVVYYLSYNKELIEVDKVVEVQEFILNHKGEEVILGLGRGNDNLEKTVTPRIDYPKNEGSLGVGLTRIAIVKHPIWKAPWYGLKTSIETPVSILKGWGYVISKAFKKEPSNVSVVGPIGVVKMMNQAAQFGFNYFLQFIAMIAMYLALFNLLPIPSLDGGRLLFLLIEKIKGGPVKEKTEQIITATFFLLLMAMFFVILFKDISSLF
jgi:regulator of sigma E protease